MKDSDPQTFKGLKSFYSLFCLDVTVVFPALSLIILQMSIQEDLNRLDIYIKSTLQTRYTQTAHKLSEVRRSRPILVPARHATWFLTAI